MLCCYFFRLFCLCSTNGGSGGSGELRDPTANGGEFDDIDEPGQFIQARDGGIAIAPLNLRDLRNSSIVKNTLRGMQLVGGGSQIILGIFALSNPITFIPGLFAMAHGISNIAQASSFTKDNIAQEIYKSISLRHTGNNTAGNVAFFGVDILSAGAGALSKTLQPLARRATSVSTINHSNNIRNAFGNSQILFKGDKILEVQTRGGALLLVNDGVLIGTGINDEQK